jgi:hypothetical protein
MSIPILIPVPHTNGTWNLVLALVLLNNFKKKIQFQFWNQFQKSDPVPVQF